MKFDDITRYEVSNEDVEDVVNRSLGNTPPGLAELAAKVTAALDSQYNGFEHSSVISSNGAIVVSARAGKLMREYLEAVSHNT